MAASSIGPFSARAGILEDVLLENNLGSLPKLSSSQELVNGLVYELGQFRKKNSVSWRCMEHWITTLCESFVPFVTFNQANLKSSMERLLRKVNDMKRNKKDWGEFLELPYNLPHKQN